MRAATFNFKKTTQQAVQQMSRPKLYCELDNYGRPMRAATIDIILHLTKEKPAEQVKKIFSPRRQILPLYLQSMRAAKSSH